MSAERRHLAMSHLWLFQAGVDPMSLDTNGEPLAQSLSKLLTNQVRDGRREAARLFMQAHPTAEHAAVTVRDTDVDNTGSYDLGELEALRNRSAAVT